MEQTLAGAVRIDQVAERLPDNERGAFHAGGRHACANKLTVPRDLAEDMILSPIVERFQSPQFVQHAVKTIRELARRDCEAQRPENSAALSKADQQIGELERPVTSGVLSDLGPDFEVDLDLD